MEHRNLRLKQVSFYVLLYREIEAVREEGELNLIDSATNLPFAKDRCSLVGNRRRAALLRRCLRWFLLLFKQRCCYRSTWNTIRRSKNYVLVRPFVIFTQSTYHLCTYHSANEYYMYVTGLIVF